LRQLKKSRTAHQTLYQILLLIITSQNIRKRSKKTSTANPDTKSLWRHIRSQIEEKETSKTKGIFKLDENNVPFDTPITNAKEALEQVETQWTKVCTPTITNESMQIPNPATHKKEHTEFMNKYPFLKKDPFSKKQQNT
jgi:hypothetical protein